MKCNNCNTESENANFCPNCGQKLYYRGSGVDEDAKFTNFFLYIGIYMFYIVGVSIYQLATDQYNDFWFTILFNLIVIGTCIPNLKLIRNSLQLSHIKLKPSLIACFGSVLLAFIVAYFAEFLSYIATIENILYLTDIPFDIHPILYGALLMSLSPAIFEELAMRSLVFEVVLKYTSLKNTILITGVMFALIHFSIVSLIWLVPIGIYLGYLRAKYRTIWYGVVFHFLYNFTHICIEYYSII